jgi:shikimate kinase
VLPGIAVPNQARVVLIGPPASGKTKVGKQIAKKLGCQFIDTDAVIVASHGPITEIFSEQGEPYFRDVERDVVAESIAQDAVVSLGGGAVVTQATRDALSNHRVVLLSISEEAVRHRVADSPKRPLLAGGIDAWKSLVESRREWYNECANLSVDVSHRQPEDVAAEIVQWLEDGKSE